MTFRIRVTLSGIKGFFRVYNVNAGNTLYSFHKQMNSDMSFPPDLPVLFKGLDERGNVLGRYGLFDLGYGAADEITFEKCAKEGIVSFVYFYDPTNRKSVNVSFEGAVDGVTVTAPVLVEVKGPDPIEFENGYVAFEDLPDDKRHLPGDNKKSSLAELLGMSEDDLDDDEDEDEEDEEDGEKDEDEEEIVDEDEVDKL